MDRAEALAEAEALLHRYEWAQAIVDRSRERLDKQLLALKLDHDVPFRELARLTGWSVATVQRSLDRQGYEPYQRGHTS